ncbi:MAG: DUF962 domain-containing protein [Rhodospirillaceae bacterium]|nr:DUF962 domain-containing protein [Rhodospirillaceae bacterium]
MADKTTDKITDYNDFWPYYLREHGKPATRGLHYIGTALALLCLVFGLLGNAAYLIAVPFAGYGFAWVAHFFVEHNKPATFTYPGWSLYSDFRMFALAVTGRLKPHLEAAGLA